MKTWPLILRILEEHGCCAMVSVIRVEGSAPRNPGARLVLGPNGFHGTIGGGALEWRAIADAQKVLNQAPASKLTWHALGPELGQCCGGRVQLATETFDRSAMEIVRELALREFQGPFALQRTIASVNFVDQFGERNRSICLFGAGHVGKAIVLALATLPFDVRWIDQRPESFPQAVPQNVVPVATADPIGEFATIAAGSFVLVMTHSHALDLAIVDAALRDQRIVHVGLIGSATKRARFEKRLKTAGVPETQIAGLICPIGLSDITSKHPAVIATSVAAQLLILDERLKKSEVQIDHRQSFIPVKRAVVR